jgi:hypothetical protein
LISKRERDIERNKKESREIEPTRKMEGRSERLHFWGKIIAVYCENHTKSMSAPRSK